jgi:hypothetical protein
MKQRWQSIFAAVLIAPLLMAMGSGRSMLHYCNTLQKGELFFASSLSQPHCDHQHIQPVVEPSSCCSLVTLHTESHTEEELPEPCCTFKQTDWSVVFHVSSQNWDTPTDDVSAPALPYLAINPLLLAGVVLGFAYSSPPPYARQYFGGNNSRLAYLGSFLI